MRMRMRSLSQEFQALQGIPNFIGAIDGSHIPIIAMQMCSLSQEFQALQGIPNVIGAIDGSHIPIIAPCCHHEDYFDRKGFHSIILQMVVTIKCLVWDYHIGWTGSMHDWNVFQRTCLGQQCENMRLGDFFLLGDSAYPARFWMLPLLKVAKRD